MTQGAHQATVVRHSVTVPIEPAAAFELFAERFSDWWPHESHHILDAEGATGILEPRRGGASTSAPPTEANTTGAT